MGGGGVGASLGKDYHFWWNFFISRTKMILVGGGGDLGSPLVPPLRTTNTLYLVDSRRK